MLNIQLYKLVNIIISNIEYNSSEGEGIFERGWGVDLYIISQFPPRIFGK
jgi:hypothetical protein